MPGSKDTSPAADPENCSNSEGEKGNDEAEGNGEADDNREGEADNDSDSEVATSRVPVTYLEQKKKNIEENLVLFKRVTERLQLTTKPKSSFNDWDVDAISRNASSALAAIEA